MHPLPAMAVPLVWHNLVLPRLELGVRGRTAASIVFALTYSMAGPRAPWFRPGGGRWVAAALVVPVSGALVASAVPSVRRAVAHRADDRTPTEVAEWVLVHIPFGTVFVEEQVFRATLDPVLIDAYGAGPGALLGAATFGLWHIHPARAAGENVPATVLVTTVAGLIFGALARHAGVAASAAAHLAINATGAALAAVRTFGHSGDHKYAR